MRTRIRFEDILDRDSLDLRRGLKLTVSGRASATLAVQVCHPHCIRLATGNTARLWTRIEDDWYGYHRLRTTSPEPLRVLPPIRFQLIRKVHQDARSHAATLQAWARRYAAWLADSPESPLTDGEWQLAGTGPELTSGSLPASKVHAIVAQSPLDHVDWDFGQQLHPLTLRDLSDAESGRVRAWRKLVRDGQLPPLLLCWISGFQTYVVLDGHDRLLAAALEGVDVPVLALTPIQSREPDAAHAESVMAAVDRGLTHAAEWAGRPHVRPMRLLTTDKANQLLISAFWPWTLGRSTRADILAGGSSRWIAEVRTELAARGLADEGLLAGLV